MTKREIALQVRDITGLNQTQSQEVVQATLDGISGLLAKFGRVELRGFGVFSIQERAERKARNPRSGEEVIVPAHETIVFKPSRLLKAEIQSQRAKKVKKTKKMAMKKTASKKAAK